MPIRMSKKFQEGVKYIYSRIEGLKGVHAQAELATMLMSEFENFARDIEAAAMDKDEGKRLADIIRSKYKEAM